MVGKLYVLSKGDPFYCGTRAQGRPGVSITVVLGYPSERTSPGRTLATACPRVADPESAGALADRAMLA